jgi:hypothetical protein
LERIAQLTERGVDMGRKAAPYIEKLEDWEYQALQALITIAEYMKKIYDGISKSPLWPKNQPGQQAADANDTQLTLRSKLLNAKTPRERAELIKKMRAADTAAMDAAYATDTKGYGDNIDTARKYSQENETIANRADDRNYMESLQDLKKRGISPDDMQNYLDNGVATDAIKQALSQRDAANQAKAKSAFEHISKHSRKKGHGSAVAPTSSPAPGAPGAASSASTDSQGRTKVDVHVRSTDDARHRPSMATPGAGTNPIKPTQASQ